jgi:catechol 2,3-dioxygenase-like lactoylglutathione lyase family enzyme
LNSFKHIVFLTHHKAFVAGGKCRKMCDFQVIYKPVPGPFFGRKQVFAFSCFFPDNEREIPVLEDYMTRYTGINHLALATGDMDTTIRFWRDLLGLRIVAGLGGKGYRQYFFEVSGHDLIAFFEWPEVQPIPEKDAGRPFVGPYAFDHVALGVENADQLWELKDRLNAADIFVTEVIDQGFIHSIYTFDPNGIAVEISYCLPEMDLRANPVMADPHPTAAAQDSLEPQPDRWPSVVSPTPPEERKVHPGEGMVLREKSKAK